MKKKTVLLLVGIALVVGGGATAVHGWLEAMRDTARFASEAWEQAKGGEADEGAIATATAPAAPATDAAAAPAMGQAGDRIAFAWALMIGGAAAAVAGLAVAIVGLCCRRPKPGAPAA